MTNEEETRTCGDCGERVPYHRGYRTWCPCGWGVKDPVSNAKTTRFQRFLETQHSRKGAALIEYALRKGPTGHRFRLRMIPVYLIIVVTLAPSLVLLVLGLRYIAYAASYPIALVPAALFLAGAWLLRPRFGEVPKNVLTRVEAPVLFAAIDTVRNHVGGPAIERMVFDDRFSAAISNPGLRQRPLLYVSPVYAAVWTPAELVAALAHELGHSVNGDHTRQRTLNVAETTLYQLERFCYSFASEGSYLMIFVVPQLMLGYIRQMLARLLWWERQSSELRADLGKLSVVGTEIGIRQIEKAQMTDQIEEFVRLRATSSDPNLWVELSAVFRKVPENALEWSRRRMAIAPLSSDARAVHPPLRDFITLAERSLREVDGIRPGPIPEIEALLQPLDEELARLCVEPLQQVVDQRREFAFQAGHFRRGEAPWERSAALDHNP